MDDTLERINIFRDYAFTLKTKGKIRTNVISLAMMMEAASVDLEELVIKINSLEQELSTLKQNQLLNKSEEEYW